MKNVKKKSIAILSVIALLFLFAIANYTFPALASTETVSAAELKEYNISRQHDQEIENCARIPTLDEDFGDDEITVILDGEHSGTGIINSIYSYDDVIAELGEVDNLDPNSIEEFFKPEDNETVSLTYRRMLSVKLKTSGKDKVIEAIKQLQKLDMVLTAEPQYHYETISTAVSTPLDTYYSLQWGLHDTYGINVETAWDISNGSGVRVGLFESGIDSGHEDLVGRVVGGNFTPAAGTDLSHGTHVGGIISAVADNNKGIAGISQATLYLLNKSNFEASLSYAANNNIKIINASFLFGEKKGNSTTYYPAVASHAQAIENYGNKGGLLICSAGNENINTDNTYHYPSGYGDSRLFPSIKNVISVGSIGRNGSLSWFSNYGENSVHIYAPGEQIYSTWPGNQYAYDQGTSMAAPHVTGAAALLLSYDQGLTNAEIKNILLNSATNITIQGKNAKLLNIGNAITSIFDPHRIGLQNVGYFSEGGGCNGGGRSGWKINVTNHLNTSMKVIYNKKMCFEGDAKAWTGLSDIDYFTLAASSSQTVEIEENGTGTHVAFSFVAGSTRYITYANELNASTKWLIPDVTTATYRSYTKNGMKVSIIGKNGGIWLIDLTNNTGSAHIFDYNQNMCWDSDAQNWTGLTNIASTDMLANGSSTEIEIHGNGNASSIAISYTSGSTRYIFWAKDLNVSCTMTSNNSTASAYSYTKNGMTVSIVGKNGKIWLIKLTNDTGSARDFVYNQTMSWEGDAQNWTGLSNPSSLHLANGETTSDPIQIQENGNASSIAISYMDGIYRKVFYAKNLDASGTMTAMENTIDTTAPPPECIAEGTLITLADGSQKAVEDLTGDEMLLVWNMETGMFDSAPILFIDSDPIGHYEVIDLTFSDNTTVDVIYEHGFWDVDLNEYVYLNENAAQYIGHRFNKQTVGVDGSLGRTEVTLTDVEISTEVTTAYSPVTYGHLCYYVNGMLSMPGGVTGLMNIFDVDAETLTIAQSSFVADIAEYGLFTYEEFYENFPVPEEIFDAFNGQYLKVSVGKGLITYEQIGSLIERYSEFF